MGMGLQGAGAIASLQAMLRARALAAQQAQQQGFENTLKVSADQRANRSLDEQTALRKATEADRVANEAATQQDHANDNARGVATLYAPGDVLPPADSKVLAGGNLGGLVTHQDATLPSTQYDGVSTLPGGPKPITGSLSMIAKAGNPEQDVFKGTAAQRAAAAKAPDAEPLVEVNQGGQPIYTRRSEAIGKPAYVKPTEPKPDHAADTRLDKSYQYHRSALDKVAAPLVAKADRFATLNESLNARTPQADALIAPEVLSVMAGGQGSGVRINEAEIERVVGGRSNLEGLKAALNKWQLDPSKALSLTDAQRAQIRSLITTAQTRLHSKLDAIDQTGQALIDAPDVMGHRRAVGELQNKLHALDAGTAAPAGGTSATTVERWERGPDGKPRKVQ